jgi:hypothetical protein
MSSFRNWLAQVLTLGESLQDEAPHVSVQDRAGITELLHEAFGRHALDVAGPAIPFDADAAIGSAVTLAQACWELIAGDDDTPFPLAVKSEPSSPAAHLSADLTLRFLADVYRRARAQNAGGKLTSEIERLLRSWPLSGVLADLDGEPATTLDFGGHSGLQLLYAERLAGTRRLGWLPQSGPSREWVERVFHERRLPLPAPTHPER